MAESGNGVTKNRLFARLERLFDVAAFADLWVLVAGCGSGGGQVALQLAMSGVRNFVLVDKDKLEDENVIRHVCGLRYIGCRKTAAVADVLRDRNPQVSVKQFDCDLMDWPELAEEVGRANVVVIGTDNEPSRYRLNEVCVETATPFTAGRVFTRGIGGEAYSYRPGIGGCLACLEGVLERSQYRDGVREIDLVSEEERQKVYDLEIEEIKDSPGLSVDIGFIAAFHTRLTLDVLGHEAPSRPRFLRPIAHNYLVWGNRAVHPFSKDFQLQRMKLPPQNGCRVCGGPDEGEA
ncbi:MAG: ThiF family adenylyltransferase [Holophagales bacterium]|nr:ThiF family adenylyltransferase [Holophagales bacterium]MYD21748.1 ThiF family adenylyltransferase [Holophagales bacterium]MYI32055.1 ThiF family adenylyltransferase [Holophagales bacterium]